jgi:hypothetical protein
MRCRMRQVQTLGYVCSTLEPGVGAEVFLMAE